MKQTLILCGTLIPEVAFGASSGSLNYWGYTLKAFGSLILVVGIIFLFFYLSKKINYFGKVSGSRIKMKSRLYLDSKHYLSIVEVDGKELLIGVGENINFIKELVNEEKDN